MIASKVDAFRGGRAQDGLRRVEVGAEGHRDLAVVGERAQRLLGHRVDHARSDQLLDVEHVGVAGVLGPGARPQRALRARAERSPARCQRVAGEALQIAPVGVVRVGDRDPPAQRRIGRERGIGLGVDARDEERGDRRDPVDRLARGDPALQAAQIGLDDLLVALDGEQQRDVDVDAAGGQLLDRADAGVGSPAP